MTDDYSELIALIVHALEKDGWQEAADALTRLSQRVVELERENFALAAGQCVHPDDGLSSDDGGTQYCKKQQRIAALESQLAARESAEPIYQARQHSDEPDRWDDVQEATHSACAAEAKFYQTRIVYAHPPAAAASEDAQDARRWRAISSILSTDEIKDIAITVAHERGVDVANAFNMTAEHLIDAAIASQKEGKE